jgi:hypothetical protein
MERSGSRKKKSTNPHKGISNSNTAFPNGQGSLLRTQSAPERTAVQI